MNLLNAPQKIIVVCAILLTLIALRSDNPFFRQYTVMQVGSVITDGLALAYVFRSKSGSALTANENWLTRRRKCLASVVLAFLYAIPGYYGRVPLLVLTGMTILLPAPATAMLDRIGMLISCSIALAVYSIINFLALSLLEWMLARRRCRV